MFDIGGECYMASCDVCILDVAFRSPFGCPVWLQHVCCLQHFPGVWTNRHQKLVAGQHVNTDMPSLYRYIQYTLKYCDTVHFSWSLSHHRLIYICVCVFARLWTYLSCIKGSIYLFVYLSVCHLLLYLSVNMRYDAWTLHPDDANEGDEQVPSVLWTIAVGHLAARSSEQIGRSPWS